MINSTLTNTSKNYTIAQEWFDMTAKLDKVLVGAVVLSDATAAAQANAVVLVPDLFVGFDEAQESIMFAQKSGAVAVVLQMIEGESATPSLFCFCAVDSRLNSLSLSRQDDVPVASGHDRRSHHTCILHSLPRVPGHRGHGGRRVPNHCQDYPRRSPASIFPFLVFAPILRISLISHLNISSFARCDF